MPLDVHSTEIQLLLIFHGLKLEEIMLYKLHLLDVVIVPQQ